jgi:hypothetical protein
VKPLALALAIAFLALDARAETAHRSGPWSLEVVDEAGNRLPTYAHRGRSYVLGRLGERYLVRVRNDSPRRIEVVASVDGRDVVDGQPASTEKRGYLVAPWSELTIDGFRLSQEAVAAFRFSSVAGSYAARMGDARDVGVVGVAVFRERELPATPVPVPRRSFSPAPPPRARGEASAAESRGAEAESRGAEAEPDAAVAKQGAARSVDRPGLGTEFGEEHGSPVEYVSFVRASARPAALLTLRYDDRRGLAALGIDLEGRLAGRERWLRETAEPFRTYAEPPPGWRR